MTAEGLRYPYVLFDLDGTLLDTVPFIEESHQHAWTTHTGRTQDPVRIRATIGRPLEFAYDDADPSLRHAMGLTYLAYNEAGNDASIGIFTGVPRMLEGLARLGARTGVVTSKRLAITRRCLRLFDLEDRFGLVVTKEDTVRHKPHPDPLRFAQERLGASDPSRVLYVGDSIHDLQGARNAGMPAALVGWTRMERGPLEEARPDLWIEEPDDLVLACLPGGGARPAGLAGGPGPLPAWRLLGTPFGPGSGRDEEVAFAVVRPEDGRVAVVHGRGTPEGAFRIPSGGRSRAEEIVGAALREVAEELGLAGRVVASAGRMEHRFDGLGGYRSTLFVVEAGEATAAPADGEIDAVRWVRPEELEDVARRLEALAGDWRGWGALRALAARAFAARLARTE